MQEAIDEGNLVPYKIYSGGSQILDRGVSYEDLTAEQQVEWDNFDWGHDEDGEQIDPPEVVNAAEINQRLMNLDTIRNVMKEVVECGIKVDGGEKLGKTIVFARNQDHAHLIAEVFREMFPAGSGGVGCEVITHSVHDAENLIERFKDPNSDLTVAVSVDMLDTGVDVPDVVNLVIFKPVYSPTKFWQMIGRGTRLRPDLFGPGMDKEYFYVFDYCDNIDRFNGRDGFTDTTGSRQRSLSERAFQLRVHQALHLEGEEREALIEQLVEELVGIRENNRLVRPSAKPTLKRYRMHEAWDGLTREQAESVIDDLADLPFPSKGKGDPEAKRFDVLMFTLQLGLFEEDSRQAANIQRVVRTAEFLLTKTNVTAVAARAKRLEQLTDEHWWDGVTYRDLEIARRELRDIVRYVDKAHRNLVVTDFEDEHGELTESELTPSGGTQIEDSIVEQQLRIALEDHASSLALRKLRDGQQITTMDVAQLETLITEIDVPGVSELRKKRQAESIGRFLRSIMGMSEDSVREKFDDLLSRQALGPQQIAVLNMIVKRFTNSGYLDPRELNEAPFTDYGSVATLFPDQSDLLTLGGTVKSLNESADPVDGGPAAG